MPALVRTRVASKNNLVKLPVEPTSIGQWSDEQIRSCVDSTISLNGTLLSQDLLSVSKDLYQSKKINTLGQLQTSYYNEENQTLISNKGKLPNVTRRFIVDIGHKKYHHDNFLKRPVCKNDNENYATFRDMMEHHYIWCFEPGEQEYMA